MSSFDCSSSNLIENQLLLLDDQQNKTVHPEFRLFCDDWYYSVFHQFRQAKFVYGGSILSSSQFLLLPQLPPKMELSSKVDSKIIVSLPEF
jgi:hypothetical protein